MTPQTTIRRGPAVLAVVLACGLFAACGSSNSSSTTGGAGAGGTSTTAPAGSGAGPTASRTAFRACLKAHGVTLPNRRPRSGGAPPGGGGPGVFGGGGGGTTTGPAGGGGGFLSRNPKTAAALKACGGSQFFRRGAGRFRLDRTAITKYVDCVRQHGFNLPRPNFSGKGPIFPSSIRTNPKFISASKPCASLLVPPRGAPSGGSGGAPPSTS